MNQRRRLLALARKGDQKAARQLMELYQVRVYSQDSLKSLKIRRSLPVLSPPKSATASVKPKPVKKQPAKTPQVPGKVAQSAKMARSVAAPASSTQRKASPAVKRKAEPKTKATQPAPKKIARKAPAGDSAKKGRTRPSMSKTKTTQPAPKKIARKAPAGDSTKKGRTRPTMSKAKTRPQSKAKSKAKVVRKVTARAAGKATTRGIR